MCRLISQRVPQIDSTGDETEEGGAEGAAIDWDVSEAGEGAARGSPAGAISGSGGGGAAAPSPPVRALMTGGEARARCGAPLLGPPALDFAEAASQGAIIAVSESTRSHLSSSPCLCHPTLIAKLHLASCIFAVPPLLLTGLPLQPLLPGAPALMRPAAQRLPRNMGSGTRRLLDDLYELQAFLHRRVTEAAGGSGGAVPASAPEELQQVASWKSTPSLARHARAANPEATLTGMIAVSVSPDRKRQPQNRTRVHSVFVSPLDDLHAGIQYLSIRNV